MENSAPWISTFHKNDWNKMINQLEKRLEDQGVQHLTIPEIETYMSLNQGKLMSGSAKASKAS